MTSASWQLSHSSFPLTTNLTSVTEQKEPQRLTPRDLGDSCPPMHLKIDQTSVGVVDPRDSANPSHPHSLREEKCFLERMDLKMSRVDEQATRAGERQVWMQSRGEIPRELPPAQGTVRGPELCCGGRPPSRGGHGKLGGGAAAQPPLPCGSQSSFLSRSTWNWGGTGPPRLGGVRKEEGTGKNIMGMEDAAPVVHCRTSTEVHPCHSRVAPRAPHPHWLPASSLCVCMERSENRPQSVCGQGRKHKLELWPYLLENKDF